MPTAVLMMIGQIAVMKITKIADGLASRNAASEIGSQASGGTVRSTWKIGSRPRIAHCALADERAEQNADDGGQTEADGDALQRRQHAPAEADVLRAVDEERIDDQILRLGPDLATAAAGSPSDRSRRAPRSSSSTTSTSSGGNACRQRSAPMRAHAARPRLGRRGAAG